MLGHGEQVQGEVGELLPTHTPASIATPSIQPSTLCQPRSSTILANRSTRRQSVLSHLVESLNCNREFSFHPTLRRYENYSRGKRLFTCESGVGLRSRSQISGTKGPTATNVQLDKFCRAKPSFLFFYPVSAVVWLILLSIFPFITFLNLKEELSSNSFLLSLLNTQQSFPMPPKGGHGGHGGGGHGGGGGTLSVHDAALGPDDDIHNRL